MKKIVVSAYRPRPDRLRPVLAASDCQRRVLPGYAEGFQTEHPDREPNNSQANAIHAALPGMEGGGPGLPRKRTKLATRQNLPGCL